MAEAAIHAAAHDGLAWVGRVELAVALLVGAAMLRHVAEASELARWARLGAALRHEAAIEEHARAAAEGAAEDAANAELAGLASHVGDARDAAAEARAARRAARAARRKAARAAADMDNDSWVLVDTTGSPSLLLPPAMAPRRACPTARPAPSTPALHTPLPASHTSTGGRSGASGRKAASLSTGRSSSHPASARSSCFDGDDEQGPSSADEVPRRRPHRRDRHSASPRNSGSEDAGSASDSEGSDGSVRRGEEAAATMAERATAAERSGRQALAGELRLAAEHLLACLPHELRELLRPIATEVGAAPLYRTHTSSSSPHACGHRFATCLSPRKHLSSPCSQQASCCSSPIFPPFCVVRLLWWCALTAALRRERLGGWRPGH